MEDECDEMYFKVGTPPLLQTRYFVDQRKVRVVGGQGGDGGHSFHSEPRKVFGGPDGGNGGDGGHVIFKGKPH